jgi:hypothetical protein
MSGTDCDDLGEMDGIGEQPLRDFLPPPDQEDRIKVTFALSRASVDFFRRQGGRALADVRV